MQWYRRLCKEKFASQSKLDGMVDKQLKNSKQAIDVCHHECIKKCRSMHIPSNAMDDTSDSSENTQIEIIVTPPPSTMTTTAKQMKRMPATTTILKQSTDKKPSGHVNGDDNRRSIDIVLQSANDDGSNNVNVHGNGENKNALSKSKETRRQKKIIVVRNNNNNCRSQISESRIIGHSISNSSTGQHCINGISNCTTTDDSNGCQCTENCSLNGNHRNLRRRVRDLENFISTIGDENETNEWTAIKNQQNTYDDAGSDPALKSASLDHEQILLDWVIVTLELERVSVCEYRFDDEEQCSCAQPESHFQFCTTSEYSERNDSTIITLHRYSSLISLAQRDFGVHQTAKRRREVCNDTAYDYGLFHSRNRMIQCLLWFIKFLDFNIKTGSVCPSTATIDDSDMKSSMSIYSSRYVSADSLYSVSDQRVEFNYLMHEPCCSQKMPSNITNSPLVHSVCSSEANIAETSVSIPDYFGLNDYGDIIIHVDHVGEEKGFGFKMHRKKNVYRNVVRGKEVTEKKINFKVAMKRFFKELISTFCECCHGHPRNKSNDGAGPGDSIGAYALTLANDPMSTFSRNIENFISCTKESREVAPQIVMRNMRQFMSGMKNYLVKHGEGDFQREVLRARSMLKSDEFLNLDTILESVMHQLVVLPLREHLYGLFVDYYTSTGDIQLLVENVKHAFGKTPLDFGIRQCIQPPSAQSMQHISLLILRMQEAELPLAKLEILLSIVSMIIETTTNTRGQALGADDFLPLLVYIVAKCGFIAAEIEAEFMWCLLQPSLLNGEAGYYLTALCSAVHVLKSFITSEQDGTGTLDFRSSSLPACSSVLRVIIPDEYNGSLQTRTLPIRPHTTTKEVCRTIAHKARVTNPQDYGLFKLVDGEETLLMDSDCPQEARLAARGKPCMLAYKRIDAKIAWPTTTTAFQ